MAGGTPVYVETKAEDDFRLTAQEVRAAITPRTKCLVLPFPNNPTGAVMGREDLEAIADVLRGTDIIVLSDEIYAELTYGQHHVSMANLPDMYERTVVVNGFSKSYAMTGWRLGYVCVPRELVAQILKLHQFGIMSAPTMSQYAAISALKNGDRDICTMAESYNQRRRFLMEAFREMGLPCFEPYGAFYVFPDISEFGMGSEEFCTKLLEAENVAVVPGSAFGACGDRHVRISYAYSIEELKEAMARIARFVERLRMDK